MIKTAGLADLFNRHLRLWPSLPDVVEGDTAGDTTLEQLIEKVSPEEEPPTIEPAAPVPLTPEQAAALAQLQNQAPPEEPPMEAKTSAMLKTAYELGISLAQEHHAAMQAQEKQATDAAITGVRGGLLKAKTMKMPKPNTSALPKTPKLQNVLAKLSASLGDPDLSGWEEESGALYDSPEIAALRQKLLQESPEQAYEMADTYGGPFRQEHPGVDDEVLRRILASKEAQSLGDPMFWQGGQEAAAAPPAAASAEEVVTQLPIGTFQGLNMKLSPEGERSTSVKVTPEALGSAETLQAIFQAEPGAKVEVEVPEAPAPAAGSPVEGGGEGPPLPEQLMGGEPPPGAVPPEM